MGRSKFIQWGGVAIAAMLALSALVVWQLESRFLYSRYFGSHRFGIEYGAETDVRGRHRILNTSFYNPPALMYGVHPFPTPTEDAPNFNAVSDPDAGLHCVYDTLGWGYIAIIDTNTQSMFCAEPATAKHIIAPDWQSRFNTLKRAFPDLPYASAFMTPVRERADDLFE